MSVVTELLALLRADSALGALLPGGIFDRPLSPNDPVTAAAWQPNAITGIKRLQPCAVMLEPQEVDDPMGRNPERRLDSELWPELVIYAEWSAMATTFDAADQRAMALLHRQRLGLADVTATGYRARPLEADELPGDVWTTLRRYRVKAVRHLEA